MDTQITAKQRLLLFLKHLGIGQTKFESQCNLSRGYISTFRSSIGSDVLTRIKAVYPELSLEWLVTGEGNMIITENSQQNNQPEDSTKLVDHLLTQLKEKDNEIKFLRKLVSALAGTNQDQSEPTSTELPHVTNPATDLGVKYYEDLMTEIKSIKEAIHKTA